MKGNRIASLLVLCMALAGLGCSSQLRLNQGLVNRLKNRGPVALSSENPYIAANLLLNREAENHPELRGFIDHRGIPAAMEVEQGLFSPLFIKLYYPESREYFNLEETPGTWLIDGPHRIPPETMRVVAKMTRDLPGQPTLFSENYPKQIGLGDTDEISAGKSEESPYSRGASPIAVPSQKKSLQEDPFLARLKQAEEKQKAAEGSFKSVSRKGSQPHQSRNRFTKRSAKTASTAQEPTIKHPAELTPKGDLVHYVTYPGETLSMISRWYTKNRDNAGRIARINNISNPNTLNIGDVVVIPKYLVKNKNRLTEKSVQELKIIAKKEMQGY
jgi:hypothetical protein